MARELESLCRDGYPPLSLSRVDGMSDQERNKTTRPTLNTADQNWPGTVQTCIVHAKRSMEKSHRVSRQYGKMKKVSVLDTSDSTSDETLKSHTWNDDEEVSQAKRTIHRLAFFSSLPLFLNATTTYLVLEIDSKTK